MGNYQVDRAKWHRMTIFEQMGNIGSEVSRALAAYRRNDSEVWLNAFSRALDLFEATTFEWRARRNAPRVKEILLAQGQFVQVLLTGEDDPGLETYFLEFALAARRNK